MDNPEVKEYIGNIVGELFKSAMPDSITQINDEFDVKKADEKQQKKDVDSVESDYRKRLSCVKDMSL